MILPILHPNTILKPNRDSNTHPQPSAYTYPPSLCASTALFKHEDPV